MKKIILLFMAFFAFVSCDGRDSSAHVGNLRNNLFPLVTCTASVFCPQTGRIAQCAVYANPHYGQRCTWEAYPAFGVRCRGWDLFGNWVIYEDYCNRW